MHSPSPQLEKIFRSALQSSFPELTSEQITAVMEITKSTQEKFGHYQCNSAMKLSKTLKKNPRQIAEAVVEKINTSSNDLIEKLEVAGPGFINITLSSHFLSAQLQKMLEHPKVGFEPPTKPQKVIIDLSSPNIAKLMHVGHLRSTIIGDTLARLFEFLGEDVLRINHVGDWGTQFGMLITYLKEVAPEVLQGNVETDLNHLVRWYKESKERFDKDPEFKKLSQQQVVALQGGDPDALKAWKIICEISEIDYQKIYDLLDVKLINRGESFYNPKLPAIVEDLEKKKLLKVSDGAKCLFLEGFKNREGDPLPMMIQKSDGGYNYDTTDIAALKQRVEEEEGERLIYVTDAGQSTHFKMLFQAATLAGYADPDKVRLDHVPFGLVLGPDGKKLRTRSGDTENLIDLLTAAIKKSEKILQERDPDLSKEERKKRAKALGIGAVKYADLSCNRVGDYTFSYERMLRFDGNTAAFLMYSFVRIAGIKRKIGITLLDIPEGTKIDLKHPSEIALGVHLTQFADALEEVKEELLPNRLTDYLYTLAEKFNAFFRDCRVSDAPEQNERLLLCEVVAKVMKQGLEILGLEIIDRM